MASEIDKAFSKIEDAKTRTEHAQFWVEESMKGADIPAHREKLKRALRKMDNAQRNLLAALDCLQD